MKIILLASVRITESINELRGLNLGRLVPETGPSVELLG